VWGDGDPEGVRKRAAKKMALTAKAARRFFDAKPGGRKGAPVTVNGFTGSSIWHSIYAFPPTSQAYWDAGFADFGKRFGPILAEFDKQNANFALEVHPTEIAFDIASAERAIEAVKGHRRFGFNYDPSHLGYQGVDYVKFIRTFGKRIFHAHMKDVWWGHGDGSVGVFGGHTNFGDARRYWDFRSVGRGDINFEEIIVALNDINYQGPLSVEWEDIRMDREHGAAESCAFLRKLDFARSQIAFDAAFDKENQ
jgi:sugar phosphate isomerase/epimerase